MVSIFIEQKLRFGQVLDRLAVLKKNWADSEQFLGHVFIVQKLFFFKYVATALKVVLNEGEMVFFC